MMTLTVRKEVSWLDMSYVLAKGIDRAKSTEWFFNHHVKVFFAEVDGGNSGIKEHAGFTVGCKWPVGQVPTNSPAYALTDVFSAVQKVLDDPERCGLSHDYKFDINRYEDRDAMNVLQVMMFGRVRYFS
jgi:hypothetical protein